MPRTVKHSWKKHPNCPHLVKWSNWCSLKRRFVNKCWICAGCEDYKPDKKTKEKKKK